LDKKENTNLGNTCIPQAKAEKLLIEMKMMVTHFPRFGHMRRPINTPVKKKKKKKTK